MGDKQKNQYLTVTPLGALFATSNAEKDALKDILIRLLQMRESPLITDELLKEITEQDDLDEAKRVLFQLQNKHYLQAEKEQINVPDLKIENELPAVLRLLSSSGKVLLIDSNGLLISYSGFAEKNIEELAVISSQFTDVYQRYSDFISEKFEEKYTSVGLINNQGISRIGFIILNIAGILFTLTVGDTPFLNQRTFRDIVWLLAYRYAN